MIAILWVMRIYTYMYINEKNIFIYLLYIYLLIYIDKLDDMYIYKQVGWWQDGMVYCVDLQLDQLTRVCACLHDDHFANML